MKRARLDLDLDGRLPIAGAVLDLLKNPRSIQFNREFDRLATACARHGSNLPANVGDGASVGPK